MVICNKEANIISLSSETAKKHDIRIYGLQKPILAMSCSSNCSARIKTLLAGQINHQTEFRKTNANHSLSEIVKEEWEVN